MKFTREITAKGLQLPSAAAKLAGFKAGEKAEYHVADSVIVALKGQMTAMELLNAARTLQELAASLHSHLAQVCGQCDRCGGVSGDSCPLTGMLDAGIVLPEVLRREAGIPEDAKLCAAVDEENHTVEIYIAGYDCDLRDIPPEIVEMFERANVCLGELEEHLIEGDVVYGG